MTMGALKSFVTNLTAEINAGNMPVEGQQKQQPTFWIEVTKGGSGFFAVMLWDGMGFPEPYQTGDGRYDEPEPAMCEAREWADSEGIEFRP